MHDTASHEKSSDERFAQYVLPELDVMYRVARTLTSSTGDAEDLVQDALVRAYRAIDSFDGRYPRAWLLTILRNVNINNGRRKRPELLRDPDDTLDRFTTHPDSSTPESVVVGETFDAVVEQAFFGLPERFRRVVQLVDLEQLSYRETADVLGLPVGTVMSRLHRARGRIRTQLVAAGLAPRGTS